jgi:hypothetical protein
MWHNWLIIGHQLSFFHSFFPLGYIASINPQKKNTWWKKHKVLYLLLWQKRWLLPLASEFVSNKVMSCNAMQKQKERRSCHWRRQWYPAMSIFIIIHHWSTSCCWAAQERKGVNAKKHPVHYIFALQCRIKFQIFLQICWTDYMMIPTK